VLSDICLLTDWFVNMAESESNKNQLFNDSELCEICFDSVTNASVIPWHQNHVVKLGAEPLAVQYALQSVAN